MINHYKQKCGFVRRESPTTKLLDCLHCSIRYTY